MQSLKSVWRTEKFKGLFAGNGANCLRVFPFSGLVCLAYANLAKVPYFQGQPKLSSFEPVLFGGYMQMYEYGITKSKFKLL